MQLFVSDKGFVFVVPMKSKAEFPDAIKLFAKEIGVPTQLIMDPSGEQSSNRSKKLSHDMGMDVRYLEESTQWANLAENYIGILKEAIRHDLLESNAPLVLWDYCAEWRAKVHNLTAKDKFDMSNMNPFTRVTGDVADISNMCIHKFYDMVKFRGQKADFPLPQERLGRFLGPCRNNGNEMAMNILMSNGSIVPRRSVVPLSKADLNMPHERKQRVIFDNLIRKKHGDSMNLPPWVVAANKKKRKVDRSFIPYEDDEEDPRVIPENNIHELSICLVDALINA